MPLSTDVNLPRSHQACFPTRCVGCGIHVSAPTMRIWTSTLSWWTWVFWWFGSGFSVRVPACGSCAWRIRSQRVGGVILSIIVGALFLYFVWPHMDDWIARPLRKWVAMGMILFCLSPYFLWETFFPPPIDITAFSDSIDYEFRDDDYAYDFAAMNDDAEWVKIS